MDIFEEAFEAFMNMSADEVSKEFSVPSKLGIKDDIDDSVLNYRLERLEYSQSMLTCFVRNRGEFFDKYIRNIFWNDSSQKDRDYVENMSYGRDFHLDCERIFRGISPSSTNSTEISRIFKIKQQYESRYEDCYVEFLPEYSVYLDNGLMACFDLVVKIYKKVENNTDLKNISNEVGNENIRLDKIFIWDWKMESIKEEDVFNRMQTKVYLYVCKKGIAFDLGCEDISMYYYMPKSNRSIKIDYNEDMHKKNEAYILNLINEIQSYKTMMKNEV